MLRTLFLLTVIALPQLVLSASTTIEISGQQLQKNLSALMPIQQQTFYEEIVVTGSALALIDKSDKINANIAIDAMLPGDVKGAAQGQIECNLHYDAGKGAFYLNRCFVIELNIKDEAIASHLDSIRDATQTAIINGISKLPIYAIDSEKKKLQMVGAVVESILVKEGGLQVALKTP